MGILEGIREPGDIRRLTLHQLEELAGEIRAEIIAGVARNGGHLASSLGAVELTLAWHYVYESPRDKLVWDVGHQSYAHKIITGRREAFSRLRCLDGLSGFPKRCESAHDVFDTGHSSTSISAALGLAEARDQRGETGNVTAVIGDGALTGGMAFEATNHAGHLQSDILVILNDNEMSIDSNVGALSRYLDRLRTGRLYIRGKQGLTTGLERIPLAGAPLRRGLERLKTSFKYLFIPGILFEELGFTYLGPVDGHDLPSLVEHLRRSSQREGPKILHVLTQKGRGYPPAMGDPDLYHGVSCFDPARGLPDRGERRDFTDAFSDALRSLARQEPRLLAITAAMSRGTGLEPFRQEFPGRFYDVGIAEQHAVTLAAGLAAGGMRPVVAIYATFMQRAVDQVIHDVCMQNLPVVFCVDRAGLVGPDGETHQGVLDLGAFRAIPNLEIWMPADETDMEEMLAAAVGSNRPVMLRYPRGPIPARIGRLARRPGDLDLLREGERVCLLSMGATLAAALEAADILAGEGIRAAVAAMRRVHPLDAPALRSFLSPFGAVVLAEENCETGGVGSGFQEAVPPGCRLVRAALPDAFIPQGTQEELRARYGLDAEGLARRVREQWG